MTHVVRRTRRTVCIAALAALTALLGATPAEESADAISTDRISLEGHSPDESIAGVLLPKRTRLIIGYKRIRIA